MPLPHEISYNARTYYSGNGSLTDFLISFTGGAPLDDSHVKVYLNTQEQTSGWSIVTVSGSKYVRFSSAPAAAVGGVPNVLLRRITPKTESTRLVDFTAGSLLKAEDLDKAQLNSLFVAQEASDDASAATASVSGTVTSVFGRDGVVVAQTGDYNAAQVTNAVTTNSTQTITGEKTFSAALTGTSGSFSTTISSGTGVAGTSGQVVVVNGTGATPLLIQTSTAETAIDVRQTSAPSVTTFGVSRLGDILTSRNITMQSTGTFKINDAGFSGNQSIFQASAGACYVQNSNPSNAVFRAYNDNTVNASIAANGNITSSPLGGSGNRAVYSNATGTLTNSSSDASLKENISTVTDGASIVAAMRPVRFDWKDKERFGTQREIGVIAQEVQTVLPEVVGANHDGTLSVDYSRIVVALIGAVKELQTRVAVLEGGAA